MGLLGAETIDMGPLSPSSAIPKVAVFWFGLVFFDFTVQFGNNLANGFLSLLVHLFSP